MSEEMFTVSEIITYAHAHLINITLDERRKAFVWYYPLYDRIFLEISTGFATYSFNQEEWEMYKESIDLAFKKMEQFKEAEKR